MKKRATLLFTLALSLTGCVTNEFYVKNGVTLDMYERDGVGCATTATQAVPTNTQIGWAPYVGIYSADTNAPLRDKNMEICMRDRGYQKIPVPYCAGEKLKEATAAVQTTPDPNTRMRISKNSATSLIQKGNLHCSKCPDKGTV
jgi:hypothetical protein